MHIHLMRVQDTPAQRCWWIKGDRAEDDLMKFKPKVTRFEAIKRFELRHGCSVTKIYTYKDGVHSQAEAVMTVLDITEKHKND